ncbi:hypothetical protein JZ751_021371 [Albula glossodonta]|uniref:Uncharacterized protein n=1 Tax=Albula glossodonta TaxID=121402 RepID=A0A8T2NJX8_9TELE|nr:hypothetical protein JZ751_021371 [Albula glossodonta]
MCFLSGNGAGGGGPFGPPLWEGLEGDTEACRPAMTAMSPQWNLKPNTAPARSLDSNPCPGCLSSCCAGQAEASSNCPYLMELGTQGGLQSAEGRRLPAPRDQP